MLSRAAHGWKVNFCKFTNETRNAIEDATVESRQVYLTAINGPCAGGGSELALATDWIIMADDGNTAGSLPEVPLLAVLPGTGGLTRLVDKRRVRRDRADFFCTVAEGIKGARAVEWGLVDEVAPRSRLPELVKRRAAEFAARTDRPSDGRGVALTPLKRAIDGDRIRYSLVACELDRARAGRRPRVHAGQHAIGRHGAAGGDPPHGDELRRVSDDQRADAVGEPLPRRAGARGQASRAGRRGAGRSRRAGGRAGHVRARRHRLGRRDRKSVV